ncbi:glycoside hydrolase family 13 protein [Spirochaeta africana]|uniref:Glycosidase n=1 Tax=Spirochaeta africana (strain ATCC 700263 / DSM 8902 / Z-7692) TaxID=889378 RepID=H9UHT9_SPIAZ|nr:glycoside hydrolase family 13 protein [Spirochaeta africana]AFG37082.1 glycosidase [Spirochaeta africana DSM 8902]
MQNRFTTRNIAAVFCTLAAAAMLAAGCATAPEPDTAIPVNFTHNPESPVHVSMADDMLSIRFQAGRDSVHTAVLFDSTGQHYQLHRQLTPSPRHEIWRAAVHPAVESYHIMVVDHDGSTERHGPFQVPEELFAALDWVGTSVGYQIFPERFYNGDPALIELALEDEAYNYKYPDFIDWEPILMDDWGGEITDIHGTHQYFGGDVPGIIEKLDYLADLGVSFLYLNPINRSGSAHGYDAVDFMSPAPNFGDEDTVRQLISAAADRGIRVMWDFVPNHVGVGFWAFQNAIAEGGHETDYWQWFRFTVDPGTEIQAGNPRQYDSWWDFGSLPELETRNEQVFNHLMDAARYWTELGFAGVRIDVPNEIVNREEFFSALRQTVREIDPQNYIVGEIWQRDASWLQGDMFDSLMNYAVGRDAIRHFASGDLLASAVSSRIQQVYAAYPEASTAMQFNLISSHDTERLLTSMGGGDLGDQPSDTSRQRQQLAAAMMYALPGVPVTYMGDEMGFTGSQQQDRQRYPLQWDTAHQPTVEFYRELGELKHALPGLQSAVIREFTDHSSLIGFMRGEPGSEHELLAVFNQSADSAVGYPLPAGTWRDVRSGQEFSGEAEIEQLGWRYLVRTTD